MKKDLTLNRIKNTDFSDIYQDFILNKNSNDVDYQSILSLAIILINSENDYIQKLGYRMVVTYCNQTQNYQPLYEIAINMGLFPISKFITLLDKSASESASLDSRVSTSSSLFLELNDAFMENYWKNDKYQSYAQKSLINFFYGHLDSSIAVVAPTSYGKTDLIISLLEKCKNKNICIITPTKSLLAQTKLRIINSKIKWIKKVITHPEMYNENDSYIVAVLTQERLLRLLRKDPKLAFDYVIVDEAHSLLGKGERDILLASVVVILEKRNSKTIFKFLTPFLNEVRNLDIRHTGIKSQEFYVQEYIKTEKFYLYDAKKGDLQLYDQFMNQFYSVYSEKNIDEISFVVKNGVDKNIVYLNKPVDIEDFSKKISSVRNPINLSTIIKACKDIAEYIHPQYSLIQCLKKGIIYHHGSVPDSIRLYIEHLYSTISEINYVVTSSTLLEGVNLPAERMFILDNKKGRGVLSPSNFKNLIGRVCRFGDIFDSHNTDLHKLEPHIYLIKGAYCSENANLKDFLINTSKIDKSIKDDPKNVLLQATPIDAENKKQLTNALEFIENYENDTIEQYSFRYVQTETGKSCFLNNITELPIFQIERTLQFYTEQLREQSLLIDNPDLLMDTIDDLFLSHITPDEQSLARQNIIRLKNQSARKFYSMFLKWRIKGASYSEMIRSFLTHWEKIDNTRDRMVDSLVFVGRWGDTARGGHQLYWTDIKNKNASQRINLAIVRIKEEQDFLDNVIIKFIEVLNDLGFMEESFYNKIKYGTDDIRKITLVKNGLSLSLSNLLVDQYLQYIVIDVLNHTVELREGLVGTMMINEENQVLTNEARYYVSEQV